jgi:uncharacterized protein (DUF58 family)
VSLKRRRAGIAFALCAVLAILALFVLDGIAAGVAALVTILAFIFACIIALGRQDPDTDRPGVGGWVGHWF